jgi:hypothetical protein
MWFMSTNIIIFNINKIMKKIAIKESSRVIYLFIFLTREIFKSFFFLTERDLQELCFATMGKIILVAQQK